MSARQQITIRLDEPHTTPDVTLKINGEDQSFSLDGEIIGNLFVADIPRTAQGKDFQVTCNGRIVDVSILD